MTRKQFLKLLNEYKGVTLDAESEQDGSDLILDTPFGKVFAANGCHSLVEPFKNQGGQSWKAEAYNDLAKRLKLGLQDCTNEDCDSCSEKI